MIKNLPVNSEDTGRAASIPGSGRYPGEGNGNPFQYSCLEYPMDRGAWWAAVHGVAKSQIRLSTHALVDVSSPEDCDGFRSEVGLEEEAVRYRELQGLRRTA